VVKLRTEALAENAVERRHFVIKASAGFCGEVRNGGNEVGIRLTEFIQSVVVSRGDVVSYIRGELIEEIVGEKAASVRGIYGCKGSDTVRHTEAAQSVS